MTRYNFPVKHGNWKILHSKTGGSKRQKCNDRLFVIIRLFQNLITLPAGVSKSCNLSECCLHSFKHSKRYNRDKPKISRLECCRSFSIVYTTSLKKMPPTELHTSYDFNLKLWQTISPLELYYIRNA